MLCVYATVGVHAFPTLAKDVNSINTRLVNHGGHNIVIPVGDIVSFDITADDNVVSTPMAVFLILNYNQDTVLPRSIDENHKLSTHGSKIGGWDIDGQASTSAHAQGTCVCIADVIFLAIF